MKHYLNSDQTTKLIELGFEKPKSIIYASAYQEEEGADPDVEYEYAYSIGELIEMLKNDDTMSIAIEFDGFEWCVDWDLFNPIKQAADVELIDALFDMVVKLKEEGKI